MSVTNPASGLPTESQYLQGTLATPATANGAGTSGKAGGYLGSQVLDILEQGGGTATVTIMGRTRTTAPWVPVGYQQVDGVTSPVRSVAAITVAAGSYHVYQILDPYHDIQAWVSGVAGGAKLVVCLALWP